MENKEIIAYACAFVSFILPKIDQLNIDEIILFGSSARGEISNKSDIDIFFNTKNKIVKSTKDFLNKELEKFYKSKINEIWNLKSIKNPINTEIGNLEKWKLKRSIISEGITLYGKYKEIPEKTKGFVQFIIKPIKNITKRNRILRKLFGRNEKTYSREGIIKRLEGKKLTPNSFIVPIGKTHEVLKSLNSEKIDYKFFEFWTDEVVG